LSKNIKIIYDIREDGSLEESERYILEEFRKYKLTSLSISSDNFCTPNEETTQREKFSCHPFFGRDKVFNFPERILHLIWKEHLAHIHIDSDGDWEAPKFQWFTTSKNAIIYSAFIEDDEYVFVIYDILKDFEDSDYRGAHNYYSEEQIIDFLELAEWHRMHHPHEDQSVL